MYVWIDALFNYVTALKIVGEDVFEKFWPANIHIMAKEITRFHAIYWPAFLMSVGIPLPKSIVAHGWLTLEGEKMSKTLGNVISPEDLSDEYGIDAARYLLVTTMRLENDGDISKERYQARYVDELANGFGNLVNRVVTLAGKYLRDEAWAKPNLEHLENVDKWRKETIEFYLQANIYDAIKTATQFIEKGNKLANDLKIWELAKSDKAKFAEAMATLNELITQAIELLAPVMPSICTQAKAAIEKRESVILFPRLN